MINPLQAPLERSRDSRSLTLYFSVILLTFGALAGAFWAIDRERFALLALATPLAVVAIAFPRVALWQFVFSLFIVRPILTSPMILVAELSAGILILSAVFDGLLRADIRAVRSGLTAPFLAILGALALSALFAYSPSSGWRPIARVAFMFVTFLSLMRILRHVTVESALKVFFWLAVANSFVVAAEFIALSGQGRLFGFAPAVFDELMMLALPVGVTFTLDGRRRLATGYFGGTMFVFLGLLATQSRGPILLGLVSTLLVVVLMWRDSRRRTPASERSEVQRARTRRRIHTSLAGIVCITVIALIASPSLFEATALRFERLLTTDPSGTFRLRLELWQTAWRAFVDHPLLGTGPGSFRSLSNVYQSLHLDPTYYWVRGLTAHNLTLHYLAEAGLVGCFALYWLFGGQFVLARRYWKGRAAFGRSAIEVSVYALSVTLLLTVTFEAGWMWGQPSFIAAFALALIATACSRRQERAPR